MSKTKKAAAPKKVAAPKKKGKAKASKNAVKGSASKEEKFLVTLSVNVDDVFTSENADLVEAILSLNPTVQIKTKAIMKVEYAGKSMERMLFARNLKRPLVNKDAATFLAKQLIMQLK